MIARLGILYSLACASTASATYSVAAVDPSTGEVGGAGASCVRGTSIYQIYVSSPGHGVMQLQAALGGSFRHAEAERLLGMDVAPDEILRQLTDPDFDAGFDRRQYGAVDLMGRSAGFTGTRTNDWKGDVQGAHEGFVYSMQGNILTGPEVLAAMEPEFRGCDLAARLMASLEAGGRDGMGDNRCTDTGIPSDGAFIQVDRRDEPEWLLIRAENVAPANPVEIVRAQFDAWRVDHPCPIVAVDAGSDAGVDAGADGGAGVDGGADAGADAAADGGTETGSGGCAVGGTGSVGLALFWLWKRKR